MIGYIILGLLVLLAFYVVSQYNWFQTTKTRIVASIQDIGNQLKRQASLIPNLEASTKGYLKHEKGVYDAIVSAERQSIKRPMAKICLKLKPLRMRSAV